MTETMTYPLRLPRSLKSCGYKLMKRRGGKPPRTADEMRAARGKRLVTFVIIHDGSGISIHGCILETLVAAP